MAANHDTDVFPHATASDGTDEVKTPASPVLSEETDTLEDLKQAAGKTAVAAVLAGAVTTGAAAIAPDQIVLPDIAPMVQTVDVGTGGDVPDSTADQDQHAKATKSSAWKKFFQILKYALIALFIVAGVIFGVLQGCASCAGSLALPPAEEESSQSS